MAFEALPSNWTSTGREFLNSAYKLLVVDLVDWLQNAVSLEGHCFAIEKEFKEQDEYVSIFCCSLTCPIILRSFIRARNFCSSLTFWRRIFFQILAHPVFKM